MHAEGVWAVVDVSVDSLRDNPPPSLMRCRRRPSGMLIQDTGNGYSKVTAVEHMEYDDRAVHGIYRDLVNSGMAFGAQRWIAILQRQCERLASLLARFGMGCEQMVNTRRKGGGGGLGAAPAQEVSVATTVVVATAEVDECCSDIYDNESSLDQLGQFHGFPHHPPAAAAADDDDQECSFFVCSSVIDGCMSNFSDHSLCSFPESTSFEVEEQHLVCDRFLSGDDDSFHDCLSECTVSLPQERTEEEDCAAEQQQQQHQLLQLHMQQQQQVRDHSGSNSDLEMATEDRDMCEEDAIDLSQAYFEDVDFMFDMSRNQCGGAGGAVQEGDNGSDSSGELMMDFSTISFDLLEPSLKKHGTSPCPKVTGTH